MPARVSEVRILLPPYKSILMTLPPNYTYTLFIFLGLLLTGFIYLIRTTFALKKKIKLLTGNTESSGDPQRDLLNRLMRTETKLEELGPRFKLVEEISKISIQKVGFLRFNPFQDTGGDNSFVLAMLDQKNDGVLLSSLYTRGGVRIYGKQIKNGQSKHQLSEEEKKVMDETLNPTKVQK